MEHEKHIHTDSAPEYDDETKRLILAADEARRELREVETKVNDLKQDIEFVLSSLPLMKPSIDIFFIQGS